MILPIKVGESNAKISFGVPCSELQKRRLIDLIEYVEATIRSREKVVLDFNEHHGFSVLPAEVKSLPGVSINCDPDDDSIWLKVERLAKTPPPDPEDSELALWVTFEDDVEIRPAIKDEVTADSLVQFGAVTEHDAGDQVSLEDYSRRPEVERKFSEWINGPWADWAAGETPRRRTINLYNSLYMLRTQLEGTSDRPPEFVCGIGFAVLKRDGKRLCYPLISLGLEISLEQADFSIEVRPRSESKPTLEIAPLDRMQLNSLDKWRSESIQFLAEQDDGRISPFLPDTYLPILHQATALLDPQAVYVSEDEPQLGQRIPEPGPYLKISEAYAFFQRDRRATQVIEDLQRFKDVVENMEDAASLPEVVATVLTEPSTVSEEVDLPVFRGVSAIPGATSSSGNEQELYFPMPFNKEQVEVVQRLQVNPGVVVQGPPGTGKTHTIANIISHYLALGKRVLVTSQKPPALRVLRDKLPDGIRGLAVSLLDSDREGLRQFQQSVELIQMRLQTQKASDLKQEISRLDFQIDDLHRDLARLDNEVIEIGQAAMRPIELDGIRILPVEAARRIAAEPDIAKWLPDEIDILENNKPQFSDAEIVSLRKIRKMLGADLSYFQAKLPEQAEMPLADEMVQMHRNLVKAEGLRQKISRGELPQLRESNENCHDLLQSLSKAMGDLREIEKKAAAARFTWADDATQLLSRGQGLDLWDAMKKLRPEIDQLTKEADYFRTKPILLPEGSEHEEKFVNSINRLANGKRTGGIVRVMFAGKLKSRIQEVRILGEAVRSKEGWQDVQRYIEAITSYQRLCEAWNSISKDTLIDAIGGVHLDSVRSMRDQAAHFELLISLNKHKEDADLQAQNLFAEKLESLAAGEATVAKLERVIESHLLKVKLDSAQSKIVKLQKLLSPCEGEISEGLRNLVQQKVGKPDVEEYWILERWTSLIRRLNEISGFATSFEELNRITNLIAASGAEEWAQSLRNETVTGVEDALLPGDWEDRWQLRRLWTWLSRIDRQDKLSKISKERREKETLLARAYERSVVLRAWHQLGLSATDSVKSALASYADSIRRIGKGTGKRAAHHRRSAREAIERAKSALPCWIMPHYRVSESIPSELGIFDLVIIDEASQSTIEALPTVWRAKKLLIVGDDKQVSPDQVGRDSNAADRLVSQYLSNQVQDFKNALREEGSVYDLGKVIFAGATVMLTEHFRCTAPIIEFSKAQFYNHQLKPIRLPKASERLDPPLIDVFVKDGYRKGNVNPPEADYIISEIGRISLDEEMNDRTIGVTTLLGHDQAHHIRRLAETELGIGVTERHKIRVGDPTEFQGDERDIMFVSMVAQGGDQALSGRQYEQRFNVALSRARDRTYLIRSIESDQLSPKDSLRRALLEHFKSPFAGEGALVSDRRSRCESDYEREVFDLLVERGYQVDTQVRVGTFRIDLVVEGEDDHRIAIECDGDRYHGPDQWPNDMMRQRILERSGWTVWRCFASRFVREREMVMDELVQFLQDHGVLPIQGHSAPPSRYTELRIWDSKVDAESSNQPYGEIPHEAFRTQEKQRAARDEKDTKKPVKDIDGELTPGLFDDLDPTEKSTGLKLVGSLNLDVREYEVGADYECVELVVPPGEQDRIYQDDYGPRLMAMTKTVVDAEAPIYEDLLVDRIARAHGKERSGRIIKDIILGAIRGEFPRIDEDGRTVIMKKGTDSSGITPFRPSQDSCRTHSDIPVRELASIALKGLYAGEGDQQILAGMAETFNLSRLRAGTRQRFQAAIDYARKFAAKFDQT